MAWLSPEDVIVTLAALTACGLLVLGTLKRPRARQLSPARGRVAPPPEDRAATALRLGRILLDGALRDPDPTSERKRRLIYRAIACLNRGVEVAPDDQSLREALGAAHAALWMTYQQMGLERLTREMPWRAPGAVTSAPVELVTSRAWRDTRGRPAPRGAWRRHPGR